MTVFDRFTRGHLKTCVREFYTCLFKLRKPQSHRLLCSTTKSPLTCIFLCTIFNNKRRQHASGRLRFLKLAAQSCGRRHAACRQPHGSRFRRILAVTNFAFLDDRVLIPAKMCSLCISTKVYVAYNAFQPLRCAKWTHAPAVVDATPKLLGICVPCGCRLPCRDLLINESGHHRVVSSEYLIF